MIKVLSPGFGAVTTLLFISCLSSRSRPLLFLFWKLALRAVNSSHSAYSCFLFSPLFFQLYKLGCDQGSEAIKCKLSMKVLQRLSFSLILVQLPKMNVVLILSKMRLFVCKSVLPLFRCLTSVERSVEQCQISVSSTLADQVMVQFFCRHGNVSRCWRCFTNNQQQVAVFLDYPFCFCDRHH